MRSSDHKKTVPITFFDAATRTTIYVESDGRHIAAIDSMGQVRWLRDPFAEKHLCAYRVSRPVIVSIEPSQGSPNEVVVRYDSSQFGTLRKDSGEFTPIGQD